MRFLALCLFLLPFTVFGETYFGNRGYDGRDGESGRDGNDGYDQTVRADGSPMQLEISGSDGYDGYDGQYGERAYNCYHNFPSDNTRGVRGGEGGRGGDGGRGGNGGNIALYYTDPGALKKVYIRSQGGRAGRAGRGGEGGEGCRCPSPASWTRKVCWKDKDGKEVCENRNFYCNAGSDGYRGDYGRQSNDGSDGYLVLIKSEGMLEPDQPTAELDFSYVGRSNIQLSKNIFKEQSGARRLLAPGSVLQDYYYSFSNRQTARVESHWMSRRSQQDFAGAYLSFRLNENNLGIYHEPRIWSETIAAPTQNGYSVNVNRIVYANETDKLQMTGITGSGKEMKLYVTDTAQVSDQLNTSIWLKYESDGVLNHTRFEGDVSPQLVHLKDHVYEIDVGQLPIKDKYLKAGEDIKISVHATRRLGQGEAVQKLKSDYKVK